ncbi:MAG: NAD-glutamate dehydrogenase domain-containing protein, partial [Pseudomonadota bacterium]
QGYDHKKMGITARGAWASVRRHFQQLSIDPNADTFTVVGIGDMSGDVFGNGMLLSSTMQMIAAFNHVHIFCDPNPDPKISYAERKRLFDLPRSQWTDYDVKKISQGGGIYLRSAKTITISPEMQMALSCTRVTMSPNELIQAILRAKVDLLWNGGIGTYFKSREEQNTAVGDRTNDALRINAAELRCRVVAEGGNLGFTQLARIEYDLAGGLINTDAIDNSAGVDCSDHEVNIKILINDVVAAGDMTLKQRSQLLAEMTEEVSALVLANNQAQNEAINVASYNAAANLNMHRRLMGDLELHAHLDRALEFLPDEAHLEERKQANKGLTRPEISVLMAYSKIWLKQQLLDSELMEHEKMRPFLESEFPKVLATKFPEAMQRHQLRRDIIATQLANLIVNEMGINFVHRLQDETGDSPVDIAKSYIIAREVFEVPELLAHIRALGSRVPGQVTVRLCYELTRLIRRVTRWFLRLVKSGAELSSIALTFAPIVKQIKDILPHAMAATAKDMMEQNFKELTALGLPDELALEFSAFSGLYSALDIAQACFTHKIPVELAVYVYFGVGNTLGFSWLREQIKAHPVNSHWVALARASFRDTLDLKQCDLMVSMVQGATHEKLSDAALEQMVQSLIDVWMSKSGSLLSRWHQTLHEIKLSPTRDYIMFSVALRELSDAIPDSRQMLN